MQPVILAIESSCDETSAAIIRNGKVLNNVIASQSVHRNYGGVVPELASRAHQKKIVQVVNEAMTDVGIKSGQLNAIAFTQGPGLMGSLLVGGSFAKGMAVALNIPLISVNHMEAHVLAHFIQTAHEEVLKEVPSFPFLCLTVSGGHTQIVQVNGFRDMKVIGETKDDAVGEAFDKAARIIGLPYPGGPLIDQYSQSGDPTRYSFPDSTVPGLDFSFSGIKTSFLYFIRDEVAKDPDFIQREMPHICASIQAQLIRMLMRKLQLAVKETGIQQVAIAGGVSANAGLREALKGMTSKQGWKVFIPAFEYCTDNAAMIAMAAHYKFMAGEFSTMDVAPVPNLPFSFS